jgi:hypothetical protein
MQLLRQTGFEMRLLQLITSGRQGEKADPPPFPPQPASALAGDPGAANDDRVRGRMTGVGAQTT